MKILKKIIFLTLTVLSVQILCVKSGNASYTNSHNQNFQEQSFKEFAEDFTTNGTTSLSSFKTYCENKISAIDYDKGDRKKVSVSNTYNYLKYYFKFKKYKIKKTKIDFTDGEFTVTLYFRKNDNGEWKLYKYDGVA